MPFCVEEDKFLLRRDWSDEEFEQYKSAIGENGEFGYYHRIRIDDTAGRSIVTPGTHYTHEVLSALDRVGFPISFTGWSVLDIGCNAGLYSTIAKVRGASKVLGVDHQEHYVRQATMVRDILELESDDVQYLLGDGHDLADLGHFDFVINTGVVYHLENPMKFLREMAALTKVGMFLESEVLVDSQFSEHAWFIEETYGGDPSNWWIYGPTCLQRMARAAGFRNVKFTGFLWRPEPGATVPEGYPRQGRGTFLCWK